METTETHLQGASEWLTRGIAERITRRKALDRLGKSAIALTLGGAAGAALADPAQAHIPGAYCGQCTGSTSCCTAVSVKCTNLPGWNQNSCPPGTCGCGSWVEPVSTSICSSGQRRYADCCGACNNGQLCTCIGGAPSCCRHQDYTNGSCNDCLNQHIKCRRWFCI